MRRLICLLITLLAVAGPAVAQDTTGTDPAAGLRGLLRYYTLGAHAAQAGDFAAALDHYEDGLAEEPTSPHLRLGAARAAAALGDTALCVTHLEHFAALGAFHLQLSAQFGRLHEPSPLRNVMTEIKANGEAPPPAKVVAILEPADIWNEGIACDRRNGDLYAGGIKHPRLVRVRDGEQSILGTSADDGLLEVLGLDIDRERGRIWAVTGRDRAEPGAKHDFGEAPRDNAVVVYDLESGEQVAIHARAADPEGDIHMWNDVSVAPDGTAYVTDMTATEIVRITPGGDHEVWHAVETVNHINGLVVSADGDRLYVVGLEGIAVVDLATGMEQRLAGPDDLCLGLGDGMALDGRNLFIVQNNGLLRWRVLHVLLSEDSYGVTASETLGCGLPQGLMPYTCAAGDGVVYVNGTADFAVYDDPELPPASVIVELPFGLRPD